MFDCDLGIINCKDTALSFLQMKHNKGSEPSEVFDYSVIDSHSTTVRKINH